MCVFVYVLIKSPLCFPLFVVILYPHTTRALYACLVQLNVAIFTHTPLFDNHWASTETNVESTPTDSRLLLTLHQPTGPVPAARCSSASTSPRAPARHPVHQHVTPRASTSPRPPARHPAASTSPRPPVYRVITHNTFIVA